MTSARVAAVIPCYKVREQVLAVIRRIGPEVGRIYVIDDCCPQKTGEHVRAEISDPRVEVLFNARNLGVGGATMAGYRRALTDGMDIVVKLDGDGQMDPARIPALIRPVLCGAADYAKGNRFFALEFLKSMPPLRLFGNAILSFMTKMSSGYWQVMDPTNGFTAIHRAALAGLPLDKISERYFFESDMLFRLNTIRAVVYDVPMEACYGGEESGIRIARISGEFLLKHAHRFVKRLFYNYILRDFNAGSIQLLIGAALFSYGLCFGLFKWRQALQSGLATPTGTIMLAAIPFILGMQFLLAALNFDVMSAPREPLQRLLGGRRRLKAEEAQDEAELPRNGGGGASGPLLRESIACEHAHEKQRIALELGELALYGAVIVRQPSRFRALGVAIEGDRPHRAGARAGRDEAQGGLQRAQLLRGAEESGSWLNPLAQPRHRPLRSMFDAPQLAQPLEG